MGSFMMETVRTYLKSRANKLAILSVFLVSFGIGVGVGYSLMDRSEPGEITPVDESVFSEEEVCAYIWSQYIRLPATWPYDQGNFRKDSAQATYQGNGRWLYQVSGSIEKTIREGGGIVWEHGEYVWQNPRVTTIGLHELSLEAYFYEKIMTFEIINITKK